MNICSRDLAIYLDQKLSKQEDVIRKGLDSEAKKLFEAAAVSFRVYRLKQASFEAAFYRGGTMQPLVLNLAFARITEERFAVLNRDPERKSQVK